MVIFKYSTLSSIEPYSATNSLLLFIGVISILPLKGTKKSSKSILNYINNIYNMQFKYFN